MENLDPALAKFDVLWKTGVKKQSQVWTKKCATLPDPIAQIEAKFGLSMPDPIYPPLVYPEAILEAMGLCLFHLSGVEYSSANV